MNIVVVSHERSGTHFLINTIARNFSITPGYIDIPRKNNKEYDNKWYNKYRKEVRKFCESKYNKDAGRIFKTHHQTWFFEPYMGQFKKHFHVFYIVRDPRDVFVSCFYYFNRHNKDFPVTKTVGDLLRTKPYEHNWDSGRSFIKSESMVERWCRHVSGWIEQGVNIITYSDLKRKFDKQVDKIGKVIGKKPPRKPVVPPLKINVVESRKGIEGEWKQHLTPKDIKYVADVVGYHGLSRFLVG
jgi:hypothetical protein